MRIRVLHLVPWIASGGVERRRLTLARHLDPERFEHRLLCLEVLTPLADRIRAQGVPITELGGTWSYRDGLTVASIRRWIRKWRPDVVHGAVYEGGVMAAWSSLGPRRHKVVVEETDVPVGRRVGGHTILGLAAHRADVCVAVSRTVGRYFTDTLRVPERRLRVILNGVEPHRPVPSTEVEELRRSWGVGPEDPIVGTVGRLFDGHKRQSDLIKAMPRLLRDHPRARLVIVGSGPDRADLEALARTEGVARAVHFTGYQADTAPYYAALDVFALVSNREACPLSLMEAMIFRRAVVTTSVGGGGELVEPERTGLHVPVGDVAGIATAVGRLFRDSGLRERLGENAGEHARQHYTAERYAAEVAALYEELTAI